MMLIHSHMNAFHLIKEERETSLTTEIIWMSPNFCCNQAEWGPPPACQLRSLQNSPHAHIFRRTTQHCRSRRPNRCRADEIQCHLGQDSISFHRSALVQNWFYEHPQFQFQYLAPFHPFLNPIEEVFFWHGDGRFTSHMSGYPSFKPWRRPVGLCKDGFTI